MDYRQFRPHPALTNYIDAYWTVTGDKDGSKAEVILPDGCVDIILNTGERCATDNGKFVMHHEKAYLVGTMTTFKKVSMSPDTRLLGIRFKPGAFSFFYKFDALQEINNTTIDFEEEMAPGLQNFTRQTPARLDHFLINRLSEPKRNLLPAVADIQNHKGQIDVKTLSHWHCVTPRQLERSFKQQIGISPKELSRIIRYQHAHSVIQNDRSNRSLLDIAYECGYYDHAHLTNDFKRYTGTVPSKY
jgi:AraC-like DNA-binding protein